jgi:hypothetical protein
MLFQSNKNGEIKAKLAVLQQVQDEYPDIEEHRVQL